jgi:hypothetical protein
MTRFKTITSAFNSAPDYVLLPIQSKQGSIYENTQFKFTVWVGLRGGLKMLNTNKKSQVTWKSPTALQRRIISKHVLFETGIAI